MYCKRSKGVHNRENETGRNQSQVGLLWLLVERQRINGVVKCAHNAERADDGTLRLSA